MATTIDGLLLYGTRKLCPGTTEVFRKDFQAWIAKHRECLVAALAFPDPSDDHLLHLVFWERQLESSCVLRFKSDAFSNDSGEESIGVFHAYGSESLITPREPLAPTAAVRKLVFHGSLAGYMRKGPTAASTAVDLPMIGIFRRAIQPGKQNALATSFQRVCDIWHETVPGILAAMVVADEDNNFVHDIRIFANKASYDAHVDKSNSELTTAMDTWFSNYDTAIPHKGIMIAEDTSDPAMRTSSIKDKPVKVDFNMCHYGQGGCMGFCLDRDFVVSC